MKRTPAQDERIAELKAKEAANTLTPAEFGELSNLLAVTV